MKTGSTSETIALLLCGGEGTRLRPITYLIRKEMLPIGRNRKPLLEFSIAHLRSHGIRDIIFLGSRAEGDDVANYFGDGRRFGVRIVYQPDHQHCAGTGHALLWAMRQLNLQDKQLLIYYGDILTTVDLNEVITFHQKYDAAATLVLSDEYKIPKGIAKINNTGKVTGFVEKPDWRGPGKVGVGMICINSARVVKAIDGLPSTDEELRRSKFRDIMGDIVSTLISRDTVRGYVTQAPWLDIGSFESYNKVREDVTWLISNIADLSAIERGLAVFLSYHINGQNNLLVNDLLVPCLEAAGMRVIPGGKLNRRHPVTTGIGQAAHTEIDESDCVIAIATPDPPGKVPSNYVQHEVAYAHGKGKLIGLFVQKGTKVPAPWEHTYTWIEFDRADTGSIIRDILKTITQPLK